MRSDGRHRRPLPPHRQPPRLRRRRHLLPVQVHAHRRRDGADRRAERAVSPPLRPRPPGDRQPDHPLVHLHRAGDCTRRDVRGRRAREGDGRRDHHAAARRCRSRRPRRRRCRLRTHPCQEGDRPDPGRHRRRRRRRQPDQRGDRRHAGWRRPRHDWRRHPPLPDAGGGVAEDRQPAPPLPLHRPGRRRSSPASSPGVANRCRMRPKEHAS